MRELETLFLPRRESATTPVSRFSTPQTAGRVQAKEDVAFAHGAGYLVMHGKNVIPGKQPNASWYSPSTFFSF